MALRLAMVWHFIIFVHLHFRAIDDILKLLLFFSAQCDLRRFLRNNLSMQLSLHLVQLVDIFNPFALGLRKNVLIQVYLNVLGQRVLT